MRDLHFDTFDRCVERRIRSKKFIIRVKVLPAQWKLGKSHDRSTNNHQKEKKKKEKKIK